MTPALIAALAVMVAGLSIRVGFRWSARQRERERYLTDATMTHIKRQQGQKGDEL